MSLTPAASEAATTSSGPSRAWAWCIRRKGVTDSLGALSPERPGKGIATLRAAHPSRNRSFAESAAEKWLARFDGNRRPGRAYRPHAVLGGANVRDLIAGYGELWSSSLFVEYLPRAQNKARRLARRQCVVVE
jgi:aspartokinase